MAPNGKKVIVLTIKISNIEKTVKYVMQNIKIGKIINEADYTWVENTEIEKPKEKIISMGTISGGYSISKKIDTIANYNTMTVDNFFFEPLEVTLPIKNFGMMSFTKTYDPNTGTFTIKRSSLSGEGIISFAGNLYVTLSKPDFLTSASGGYDVVVDCTKIDNWQHLTINNFLIDLRRMEVPDEATGTILFTKSYDASTGTLKVTRNAITGAGLILFYVEVYYIT